MNTKIKTLITMIPPLPEVKKILSEIEPYAEIRFLKENETLGDYIEDIEVLYSSFLEEKDLVKAKKLKWIQTNSTGIEQLMYPAFKNSDILLTNTGRSISAVVADHAMALFLTLARNIHIQRDFMKLHKWEIIRGRDIGNMTLGILGFGKIGQEVALRARNFIKTLYVLDINKLFNKDIIDKVFTLNKLDSFLKECDAIICSLPLTPQTNNLISDKEFDYIKKGSYLINISRGEIININALLRALRSGKLAGAGIDVFEKEPCPPDSPIWDETNLIITPHSAGYCETMEQRKIQQFVDNFKYYLRTGNIPLSIDKTRGW